MTIFPWSPYPRKLYFGEDYNAENYQEYKNTIKKREKKEEPIYIKPFKNV